MSFRSKLYYFVNRIVTIVEDKSKDIIKYDIDNLFPQNLIRQIGESGTATSCIEALIQYTYADGLVDEELGKTLINDNTTLNQLTSELIPYACNFQGVALHILRNTEGGIAKVKILPFENIRKSLKGNYIYNPTYSINGKIDIEKDVHYPAFRGSKITPVQVAAHVANYGITVGEILYYFKKKPGQYDYPIPTFYSAISDIDTDAENSKYELESVNNSFLPSGILTLVGDIDDKNKDDYGLTEWGYMEQTLEGFTGQAKDSTGASGRQKLAVLHAKTKEEIPIYQQINNEGILTAIDASTKRVAEKVARAFGVPPFIIGLGGNVGFATNIISDNITLFNNRIKVLQELVLTPLRMCFPEKEFELTQLNPIKYIDPIILQDLTPAERREIVGYKTDVTKSNTTVSLAQTLGVGSTTSLLQVLQDTTFSRDQKINTLEILFNLTPDSAQKLVPL